MVYCLRNYQFCCRHQSKSSRAHEHLNLYFTDSHYTHVQFAGAVSENGHCSRRLHGRHSRSRAQSFLPSGGDRSEDNQQPEVRRCGVHTDGIRSCRRLTNRSSHRASPCSKGRSRLLDPRRTSVIRASNRCLQRRQELGRAGHRRDGTRGADGAGGAPPLHALPIAGHNVRRPVIERVRQRHCVAVGQTLPRWPRCVIRSRR